MSTKNSNDYLESLFEGVTILIDKKLESVSFDSTIICTIIEDTNKKDGKYRVTNGSVPFEVFSDVSTYKVGDQVRVTIPMGDYGQKKFIIGKYTSNNDIEPITYVSPVDKILNISGNLANNVQGSIAANGQQREIILWQKKLDNSFMALQDNNIFNTIILKSDFKTALNYNLIEGNYGLRLDFLIKPSIKSDVRIKRSLELDSSEMFGNPYAFSIYSPQAKVIKINNIGIVMAIELTLYQKGNFKDSEYGIITPLQEIDNIFVNNVEIGLGCDLTDVEGNKLQIYTESDPSYLYGMHDDTSNLKTMGLLWFNKDENNQYIGFSDGIYDHDYDEIAYLKKSREDTRLIGQKGKEGVPQDKTSLNLQASLEEALPNIRQALDIIDMDLNKVLYELKSLVEEVEDFADNIDILLSTPATSSPKKEYYLPGISSNINNYLSNTNKDKDNIQMYGIIEQQTAILQYGYDVWKGKTTPAQDSEKTNSIWKSKYLKINYHNKIKNEFNNVEKAIQWLFSSTGGFNGINSTHSGFKSIYDTYKIRVEKLIAAMKGYLGQLSTSSEYYFLNKMFPQDFFNKSYNELMLYQTKEQTSYKLYKGLDFSEYSNKYCIYWYRYEKDYVPPSNEQILPDGWRRLSGNDFKSPHGKADNDGINIGLSSKYLDEKNQAILNSEGKPVHAPKVEVGKGLLKRYMQNDLTQEKYIAVLFYNHEMYKSNELIFTNSEVVPDKTTLDKGDILTFEHISKSSDSYQVYDITNNLMDRSDEYVSRQIRCHYDGLLAKDNAFVNGQIYWYVPTRSTMITIDMEELTSKKFTLDSKKTTYEYIPIEFDDYVPYEANKYYILNGKKYELSTASSANSRKTYYDKQCKELCFYKKIEATEKNGSEDIEYEWDKWNYSSQGSSIDNRDFWYKIKPYYEGSSRNNSIRCEFIKNKEADIVKGEQFFSFGIKGTCGTKYTLAITNNSSKNAITASDGLTLGIELKDFNNELVTLSDKDLKVQWYNYLIPSGASAPSISKALTSDSTASCTVSKNCCAIINATAKIILDSSNENLAVAEKKTVDLSVLYSVPYSTGEYYIQGPTEIIYNSLGTLDNNSMFDTPYKIFAKKDIYQNDTILYSRNSEIPNVTWSLEYYKINGKKLEKFPTTTEIANMTGSTKTKAQNEKKLYKSYMPKLQKNSLIPAPLYLDQMPYQAVLVAKQNGNLLWKQPIIIIQNRYASPMLNDWNGKYTVDEKNGTIMGTMFGAGRKNSNNTFDGVLMGNVALGSSATTGFQSNHSGIGIYGFNEGAQSFGFNVDGTAFLGKAGRGRIIFNGNHGLIASADWASGGGTITNAGAIDTRSTKGMCIDLDNGHIDAYDFALSSSNIYLNSNPTSNENILNKNYFFKIGQDSTSGYVGLTKNGKLEIRINSLEFTGVLGNENLLQQTSPRQNALVYHWLPYNKVTKAVITTSGTTQTKSTTKTYKKVPYKNADKDQVFTWDLSKWTKRKSLEKYTETNWSYDKAYGNGVYVNHLGNVWKSKKAIAAHENPPGNNSNWSPVVTVSSSEKPYAIVTKESNVTLTQSVALTGGERYTLSGYIKLNNTGTFKVILGTGCKVIDASLDFDPEPSTATSYSSLNTSWHRFKWTFEAPSTSKDYTVGVEANKTYSLWNVKLEEGTVSSAWCPSPKDVEKNISVTKDNYNIYLGQDKLFDKLFTDDMTGQKMDGIQFVDASKTLTGVKELYINATYISTGILRSKNWNGTLTREYNSTKKKYELKLSGSPTQGMYINLDDGKIWSRNFQLTAGTANNDGYLYLSNGASPSLSINGSSASTSWRIVSGKNFGVTNKGKLYAKNAVITGKITASSGKIGGWNIESSYIDSYTGDSRSKCTARFYLASDANSSNYYLYAGSGTVGSLTRKFSVSKAGVLYAKGATIDGIITAGSGSKIGGWTITSNAIYAGKMYLYSTGQIKSSTGKFSVSSGGVLSASDGIFNTATIKDATVITATIYNGTFYTSQAGIGWVLSNNGVYCMGNAAHPATGFLTTSLWLNGEQYKPGSVTYLPYADNVVVGGRFQKWLPVYKKQDTTSSVVGYIAANVCTAHSVVTPTTKYALIRA